MTSRCRCQLRALLVFLVLSLLLQLTGGSHTSAIVATEVELDTIDTADESGDAALGQPTLSPTLAHQLGLLSRSPTRTPTRIPTDAPVLNDSGDNVSEPSLSPTTAAVADATMSPTAAASAVATAAATEEEDEMQPSSQPTSQPTMMPTRSGVLGRDWWYVVNTAVKIMCDRKLLPEDVLLHSEDDLLDAVQYAFNFLLTDNLKTAGGEEKLKAEVHTYLVHEEEKQIPQKQQQQKQLRLRSQQQQQQTGSEISSSQESVVSTIISSSESTEDVFFYEYNVKAWVWRESLLPQIMAAARFVEDTPVLALEPMHERGMKEVFNITISHIRLKSKNDPPPSKETDGYLEEIFDDPQEKDAPEGITFIIIGTLILFTVGTCIIGNICSKDCICTYSCVRSRVMSFIRCITLLMMAFRYCVMSVCSDEEPGFELAPQDDDQLDDEMDEEYHSHGHSTATSTAAGDGAHIEMVSRRSRTSSPANSSGNISSGSSSKGSSSSGSGTYARPPEASGDASPFDSRTV